MPKDGSEVRLDGQGNPLWLLLELTYRCPLKCAWCNNPLDFDHYRNELTTEEWMRVMREGRELGALQLGLSGGEPMMRRDVETLVAEASRLGYYTNLITSGIGLDSDRLQALKDTGLNQIQLSIQSCDEALNDELVGTRAFEVKLDVARRIKAHGFPMVLNVPVCRQNIDQAPKILAMAEELSVDYLEFANLQYYNWAMLNREELLPSRAQLQRAEVDVRAARQRLGKRMTIYFVVPDYYDGRPKACMNGWGSIHFTIAPDGTALPCQEARVIKGLAFPSVRNASLEWIWKDSPTFNLFRGEAWMKEPCRTCSDRTRDFGGCRCQAFMLTGDASNPDPACSLSPHHYVVREAVAEANAPGRWPRPLVRRQAGAITTAFAGE
ncbi:MAG: pyrroloquinoline quinone biosynthesis protein PqqE [Candidatus Rokubacteria bacterium]|nr:pyrroloquinoline quinone biosynthesis protein PqqE [Candidatus Rokubacteria bacterium]